MKPQPSVFLAVAPSLRLRLVLATALLAAASLEASEERVRYELTPVHQNASTLAPDVIPFLSPGGSIELRAAGRTLVVTDTPQALSKIVPLLKHLDRPRTAVEVTVRVLRASRATVSGEPGPVLPVDIQARLAQLMPGRRYELLSERVITSHEGSTVRQSLDNRLDLAFEVGAVLAGRRLRLSDFTLTRPGEGKHLMRADVNLWVDRPVALALTESTGPGALVLIVEGRVSGAVDLPPGSRPRVGGDPVTRQPSIGGDPTARPGSARPGSTVRPR